MKLILEDFKNYKSKDTDNDMAQDRWQAFICTNFKSMAPGKCDSIFKSIISEHMLRIKFMST